MANVKRLQDLTSYKSVLPYASELFGIFQPLLGWKSVRIRERYRDAFDRDRNALVDRLARHFTGVVEIVQGEDGTRIRVRPGGLRTGTLRQFDSVVLDRIGGQLPPHEEYRPDVWASAITPQIVDSILDRDVTDLYLQAFRDPTAPDPVTGLVAARPAAAMRAALDQQLRRESSIAALVLALARDGNAKALEDIFYATKDVSAEAGRIARMLAADDSLGAFLDLETLDPRNADHLKAVALSPIGVVHLFRQYFFELDTFLGPPQSHVWLSPGSNVELIETQTRRSVTERTLASVLETTLRSETSTTTRDEIAEAVKDDNERAINVGAGVKAKYGSVEATASFDLSNSQKTARETTHKRMREQTEKLSSEIRRNLTSTFKVLAELTDTSSTKHLLANSTDSLINYELRRKMEQVVVQVQDAGSYLCWQAYVDDPARALGIAELIHIAAPPGLDGLPHPEEIPRLEPFQESRTITIPFISAANNADNEGEVYVDGNESVEDEGFFGKPEKIKFEFPQRFICPRPNYDLTGAEFDPQGKPIVVSIAEGTLHSANGEASFTLHLDSADFQGQNSVQIGIVLHWIPSANANNEIEQKNQTKRDQFTEETRAAYERARIEAVKERVTAASQIRARSSEDLREEERILVYRQLVQDALLKGIPFPDDRTRHVAAELINAIFDIEKMLYFVAPEWWRPRRHRGRQQLLETARPPGPPLDGPVGPFATEASLGLAVARRALDLGFASATAQASPPALMSSSRVAWGGAGDPNRDNYYITSESEPAKLGSSLGWLLQLDGDNMRNAFLNAPWVKAVVPIRPGKEEAAINWLKGVEGMDGITDDVVYRTDNPNEKDVDGQPLDGQKMIDVLMDLAEKIRRKYLAGLETGRFPRQDDIADPALVDEESTVTATPIDRVYEHGFFPLKDGFRANVGSDYEIFDQWIEILPTDQSVPVPVAYDPATGRQI